MAETLPLEQRVAAVVDQHRGELERLVHERVDALLVELVQSEIVSRNGSAPRMAREAQERHCKRCGETKPLTAFEAHRHTCRDCRREQARTREQRSPAATDDVPRPG